MWGGQSHLKTKQQQTVLGSGGRFIWPKTIFSSCFSSATELEKKNYSSSSSPACSLQTRESQCDSSGNIPGRQTYSTICGNLSSNQIFHLGSRAAVACPPLHRTGITVCYCCGRDEMMQVFRTQCMGMCDCPSSDTWGLYVGMSQVEINGLGERRAPTIKLSQLVWSAVNQVFEGGVEDVGQLTLGWNPDHTEVNNRTSTGHCYHSICPPHNLKCIYPHKTLLRQKSAIILIVQVRN